MNLIIQKLPLRIKRSDQFILFLPPPLLYFLFSGKGMFYLCEVFIINQVMAIIPLCKPFIFPCFVFFHPSFQIICDTNVQNVFVFVGHNVNEVVVKKGHDFSIKKTLLSFRFAGGEEKSPNNQGAPPGKKLLKGGRWCWGGSRPTSSFGQARPTEVIRAGLARASLEMTTNTILSFRTAWVGIVRGGK